MVQAIPLFPRTALSDIRVKVALGFLRFPFSHALLIERKSIHQPLHSTNRDFKIIFVSALSFQFQFF
jgi:hypothetical protein